MSTYSMPGESMYEPSGKKSEPVVRDVSRVGTWDTYQQQANPLVIELSDGTWKDLTISDLRAILKG